MSEGNTLSVIRDVFRAVLRPGVLHRIVPAAPGAPAEAAEPTFRYGLECPVCCDFMGERIEVRGWAASFDGQPVQAEIIINDEFRLPIVFSELRLDVARAFGLSGRDARVGFRHHLSWEDLGEGWEEAQIRLVLRHGEAVMTAGPVRVFRSTRRAAQKFALNVEKPAGGEVVSGDIEVRGWFASLDGQPTGGKIVINGLTMAELALTDLRPDVQFMLDLPPDSGAVGFAHHFDWRDLGEGVQEAHVAVEFVHGGDLVVLGPYTVKHSAAPVLRHQRGSYREVWDGAAHNEVSAMASVAGTSDPEQFDESGVSTARTLIEALQISKSDVVLEIGCGVGRIGQYLAPLCAQWIGGDISQNMINFARQNLAAHKNVQLAVLPDCSLRDFDSAFVDKVYCSTVFMHLDEWDRFRYISESYRVLKRGGRCYVDNINLAGEIGWAIFEDVLALDPAQRPACVSKPSTEQELVTYLKMAGFVDIQTRVEPLYISVTGTKI